MAHYKNMTVFKCKKCDYEIEAIGSEAWHQCKATKGKVHVKLVPQD